MDHWELRERATDPVTCLIEMGVSVADFPFALVIPSPPWAFGRTVALLTADAPAELIRSADETRRARDDAVAALRELDAANVPEAWSAHSSFAVQQRLRQAVRDARRLLAQYRVPANTRPAPGTASLPAFWLWADKATVAITLKREVGWMCEITLENGQTSMAIGGTAIHALFNCWDEVK